MATEPKSHSGTEKKTPWNKCKEMPLEGNTIKWT